MTDPRPHQPDQDFNPSAQRDESKGTIKGTQRTDATMTEKDMPLGSERHKHLRK